MDPKKLARMPRLRQVWRNLRSLLPAPASDERPTMTPERYQLATEILHRALQRDGAERDRFLHRACKGDRALRREVESLLGYERVEVDVLDQPLLPTLPGVPGQMPGEPPAFLFPGQRIGPYEILRKIGQGGMGAVALARRADDFEMRVALKLIRREKLSPELEGRFHRERQILADLDHPNIARIFDGGTTDDGLPYFAMEYVRGEPIDCYCDQRRLTIRQRLELFREVCSALHYSHQRLVVHRDLKPGNILITDSSEPKVLDFGIAKELDPDPDPERQLTQPGHGPMSTAYASPQQVLGEPITTSTDVYSLGVILYELLTGHHPYRLDGCEPLQRIRRICEQQPPRPSTAVGRREEISTARGTTFLTPQAVSEARRASPLKLRRRLAGDLDSILLKALRKDPEDRYGSVERLSEDIRCHLQGLPVMAREGTVLYRSVKFVRRNRWRLLAAAVLLSLTTIGVVQVERAELDRRLAAERVTEANEQAAIRKQFLSKLFLQRDVESNQRFTARELLDRAEERIRRDLQREELATQLEILGEQYLALGLRDETRRLFEDVLALRRQLYEGDHPLIARVLSNLATWHHGAGDSQRAAELYQEALDMRRRLGQDDIGLVPAISNQASILTRSGDLAEAEELYRWALAIRKKAFGRDDRSVAKSQRDLGNLLYLRGEFAAAEPLLRRSLKTRQRVFGKGSLEAASAQSSLARVLHGLRDRQQAETLLADVLSIRRELLGDGHEHVAVTLTDLAALALDRQDLERTGELLTEAQMIFAEKQPSGPEAAVAKSLWGAYLVEQRRYLEAESFLAEGYRRLAKLRGEEAIYTRRARVRLENLYRAQEVPIPVWLSAYSSTP